MIKSRGSLRIHVGYYFRGLAFSRAKTLALVLGLHIIAEKSNIVSRIRVPTCQPSPIFKNAERTFISSKEDHKEKRKKQESP